MKKFSWHKFYKFPTGHTLRSECEYPYKPPMKGGHTHNHIYNKCHKYVFRGKNARKIASLTIGLSQSNNAMAVA